MQQQQKVQKSPKYFKSNKKLKVTTFYFIHKKNRYLKKSQKIKKLKKSQKIQQQKKFYKKKEIFENSFCFLQQKQILLVFLYYEYTI